MGMGAELVEIIGAKLMGAKKVERAWKRELC
jgi:hypothetical protein